MTEIDTSAPARATAKEFRMPSLGADMQSGTVVAWRVKPGDRVRHGDVVADVETEKGVFEVEIGSEGIVDELLVERGTKVPVGTVLARLRGAEVAPVAPAEPSPPHPPAAPVSPAVREAPVAEVPVAEAPAVEAPVAPSRGVRASPLARHIAAAKGIDLTRITGTGPDGAITKADVERASAPAARAEEAPIVGHAGAVPPAPVATARPPVAAPPSEAMTAMRHAVAVAVSRSKREIPHYYLGTDIELGAAMTWLATANQARAITDRILPAALLLRSVALALRTHGALNGFWIDDTPRQADRIHLGIAISLRGGGLIAPAIHDADRLSVPELMHALADLVKRARSGGLRSSEMTDATITVSNLGDEGVASVFGVIYPPQVALVGFGRIGERPWAENGMLGVRPVVTATLAADHRATDGHYGGRFLAEVARLLHSPESL